MEQRDSYRASTSDFHTHVHDLPPQIGRCIASNTGQQREAAAAIDGTDGVSWHLPLPALRADSLEPAPAFEEDEEKDRVEVTSLMMYSPALVC